MTPATLILVVEDEPVIQDVLEDTLKEAGFAVKQAFSGAEAIEMLDQPHIRYRALITDVKFKAVITGWDVARHVRQLIPEIPVIYATATTYEWEAMGVPNSILIKKPFAPSQIVTALTQLLNAAPSPET